MVMNESQGSSKLTIENHAFGGAIAHVVDVNRDRRI